jgi:hypothetical protein
MQRKLQLPPEQVKVQLALSLHVISQPPPAQSALHVDWPLQVTLQLPLAHVSVHWLEAAHVCVHV